MNGMVAAYCYTCLALRGLCVCLWLATPVRPAKTAEQIQVYSQSVSHQSIIYMNQITRVLRLKLLK